MHGSSRMTRDGADEEGPSMRGRRTLVLLAALLVAAAWAVLIAVNLRSARMELARRCGEVTPEKAAEIKALFKEREPSLVESISPSLDYREVWLDQMKSLGGLVATGGRVVMWTGEATYINRWPLSEFKGEYYLYDAWKRFPHDDAGPVFFRFLVGSFDDRKDIGVGRAIVIGEESRIGEIEEGDKITLLAEVAGTDYTVGSLILYAHDVYIWE